MAIGICPECDSDIRLAPTDEPNDIVTCDDCGTDLEIVGLDPVELEILDEEPDAGDYEDEDEDEY